MGPITKEAELITAIETAFQQIEVSTLEDLVHSMPSRVKAVIANKGGPLDY